MGALTLHALQEVGISRKKDQDGQLRKVFLFCNQ